MEISNLTIKYKNLLKLFLKQEICLSNLISISQKEEFELYLFLQILRLKLDLPDKFLETLLKDDNNNINKYKNYLNSKKINNNGNELSEEQIKTIKNIIEIYYNCHLRNIDFFNLDLSFIEYILSSNVTIQQIDKWILSKDNEQMNNLQAEVKFEIEKMFCRLSPFELFLEKSIIVVDPSVTSQYKYEDLESLKKKISLKSLLEIYKKEVNNQKPVSLYKKLIEELKTYSEKKENKITSIIDIKYALEKLNIETIDNELKEIENKFIDEDFKIIIDTLSASGINKEEIKSLDKEVISIICEEVDPKLLERFYLSLTKDIVIIKFISQKSKNNNNNF